MTARRRSLQPPLILAAVAVLVAVPLSTAAADSDAPTSEPGPTAALLVKFRGAHGMAEGARGLLEDVGASDTGEIDGLGVRILHVPAARAEAAREHLTASPLVEFAEPDANLEALDTTPNDPWWPNEWSPVKTRAPAAWDTTTGSSSVVVAVLDTGVDFSQPDLQGAASVR